MESDSAESRINGDGSKEILAPEEGPRENLINTAIKFLQNPKVMTSPLSQKKAFLEKKGLTQDEINLAIQRSGVKEASSAMPPVLQGPSYPNGVMAFNPHMPPGNYVAIPPQSGWAKARDLAVSTALIASVSYAVYQVFQTYLRPLLFGKSFEERRLAQLEKNILDVQKSVADSLAGISTTLSGIQESLNKQNSQQVIGSGDLKGISELKADISSLKGLLLNKSQFPPAPSTSPVLPSWQRIQAHTTGSPSPTSPAGSLAPAAAAATGSQSYADVVKTSQHGDHSSEQAHVSELPDSLEPSSETSPTPQSSSLTDNQDLSDSKLTEPDSSLT